MSDLLLLPDNSTRVDGKHLFQPASGDGREQRIRRVFNLRSGAGLPRVDEASLLDYFHFLADQLPLPFAALYWDEAGSAIGMSSDVTVVALPHPREYRLHRTTGLLCTAQTDRGDLHVPLADIRRQEEHSFDSLVEDYWYWFWNWQ